MLTSNVAILKRRAGWTGTGAVMTVWPLPRPTPVVATAWPATPRGVGESRCFEDDVGVGHAPPPPAPTAASPDVRAIQVWLRFPAA